MRITKCVVVMAAATCLGLVSCVSLKNTDGNVALDQWNEGVPKAAIKAFVTSVTDAKSASFLPPEERIATFDMDGTILIEKPMYVVFDFALHIIQEQLADDPSLKEAQPYKAIVEKDVDYFHRNVTGENGLFSVLLYATDGMTDEKYQQKLVEYLEKPHARFGVPPDQLLYAPVVQLIDYLHAHDFQVYICSGSDPEFTRGSAAESVGIPPEHVIGTTVLTLWNDTEFVREHQFIEPINDEAGKPVNIRNKIGRIPVLVVGNSRGDLEMLNYSKLADHSLQLVVNHDDPEREYEYSVDKMKKLCAENDWIEISMKHDFKQVFDLNDE